MVERYVQRPYVTREDIRRADELVKNYTSESGVTFVEMEGLAYGDYPPFSTGFFLIKPSGYRESQVISNIGGLCVCGREIEEINSYIPGVKDALNEETDKIVILGNGTSNLPVDLARRFKEGNLRERPVIVDLFDYDKLLVDHYRLQSLFAAKGLPAPSVDQDLESLEGIVFAIKKGTITAVNYKVGSGDPPQNLKNASLILNFFGPPSSTLPEQLDLLKVGGKLFSQFPKEMIDEKARGVTGSFNSISTWKGGICATVTTREN